MKKATLIAKRFFNLIFPANSSEWTVFFVSFFSYGAFAAFIALNYRIIFDDRIPWDAYFSFDNRAIVMTGGGFERHPLSNYFFDWVRTVGLWISGNKFNADFRLYIAVLSVCVISLTLVQIFKYFSSIIRLPHWISVLLTAFFGFFTTVILLSFTPETYTYTMFLLILFNNYAAEKIRNDEKVAGIPLALSAVAVGGLTITNMVKVFIPVIFEKNLFRSWKNFGNAALRVFLSVGVLVLLYLNRLNFDITKIFNKTGEQYEKFSKPMVTPVWDMIVSWFLGGNMLFPGFVIRDYHSKAGFQYKALFMDTYSSNLSYAFVFLIIALLLWSFTVNYKNKLVQILFLSFGVDILIHCVLKFGLHTSYIYGGHYIFIVPLVIGWLFFAYRKSPKVLTGITVLVSVLFVYLVMNNIFRLQEFMQFLDKFYR